MKKVLLVEDDPFIRDITSIKLTEQGNAVLTAPNGAEALTTAQKEHPDAVLLDLDLPDMSGLDVMRSFKGDETLKEVPIIIFSNNDNSEILAEAKELGAVAFFVKASTNFDDLYTKLQEIFKA